MFIQFLNCWGGGYHDSTANRNTQTLQQLQASFIEEKDNRYQLQFVGRWIYFNFINE